MAKKRQKANRPLSPSLTTAEAYCAEVGLPARDTAEILSQCSEDTTWPAFRKLVVKRCRALGITIAAADDPEVRPGVLNAVLDRIEELRERSPVEKKLLNFLDRTNPLPPATQQVLFDATTGKLSLPNGTSITLTAGEKYVLEILVEKRTASLSDLQTANDRPDRVLKRMVDKYPMLKPFINLPGGGGRGGYSTTIEPAKPE